MEDQPDMTPDGTITYVTHPSVTFLTSPEKLISDMENIYTAYRQCYKSDPDSDGLVNKILYEHLYAHTLQSAFEADTSHLNAINIGGAEDIRNEFNDLLRHRQYEIGSSMEDNAAKVNFYRYLAMCRFIKNHMIHESPLEHVVLSVRITDASRSWSIQQVRHRIAAISQMSQKYCGSHGKYIVPAAIRENEEALAVFKSTIEHIEDSIAKLTNLNIPRDDVRMLLPNATETQMVFTANLREWMHICEERCCSRASWEINYVAWRVLRYLQTYVPFVFSERGPKCLRLHGCPEEKPCGFYTHHKARIESA